MINRLGDVGRGLLLSSARASDAKRTSPGLDRIVPEGHHAWVLLRDDDRIQDSFGVRRAGPPRRGDYKIHRIKILVYCLSRISRQSSLYPVCQG